MTRTALAAPEPADRFLYWRCGPLTLYLGDALAVLAALPADSVDTVVTSPPYYGLRDYGVTGQYGLEATPDRYVQTMRAVFDQVRRVLRPEGTLWLNLGDSYSLNSGGAPKSGWQSGYRGRATAQPGLVRPRNQDLVAPKNLLGIPWRVALALQADGWYLRQSIIWHKPNSTPESVKDRPSCNYEYVFLLARSRRYYFNLDAIRTPLARPDALDGTRVIGGANKGHAGGIGATARRRGATAYGAPNPARHRTDPAKYLRDPAGHHGRGERTNLIATGHAHTSTNPKGRNPGSVWSITTRPYKHAHFAVFPLDLPLACIAAGCPPAGRVLDPFSEPPPPAWPPSCAGASSGASTSTPPTTGWPAPGCSRPSTSGGADMSDQAAHPPGDRRQPPVAAGTANDSGTRRGSVPPPADRGIAPPRPVSSCGQDRTGPRAPIPHPSPDDGESRYRRAPITGDDVCAGQPPVGAVRLALTEPATVPMTAQEYDQAVTALASMIATWLRRQAPPGADGA